ncbi:VWA domain-containing protein [Chloroflexota bacterium]
MSKNRYLFFLISLIIALSLLMTPLKGLAQSEAPSPRLKIDNIDDSRFPNNEIFFALLDSQGFPINSLVIENVSVAEDGDPITVFTMEAVQDEYQPLAFMLAIDTSGSMYGQPLKDAVDAAKNLISQLNSTDVVGLLSYSDSAHIIAEPTMDHALVLDALDTLTTGGNTAVFDAIMEANKVLKDRSERKSVILLTDGRNSALTTYLLNDAVQDARSWGIPVYPVGFGDVNRDNIMKLADQTGGSYKISPDSSTLKDSFDAILGIFRNQYKITYASSFPADKTEHVLSIEVEYEGGKYNAEQTFTAWPGTLSVNMLHLSDFYALRGWVKFSPEIIAPGEVERFQVLMDGNMLDEKLESPFEITWKSTLGDYGMHDFVFYARDVVGNEGQQELTLEVKPPIIIRFDTLQDGDVVSGNHLVTFSIDAEYEIASVEIFANDISLGVLEPGQRSYTWNTRKQDAGEYALRIDVSDVQGFTGEASVNTIVEIQILSLIIWFGLIALAVAAAIIVPISLRARKKAAVEIPLAGEVVIGGPFLVELEGLSPQTNWQITEEETRLGRRKADNDIPLKGLKASRQQAVIRNRAGVCTIFSLKSDNPVVVNGASVPQKDLEPGDVIRMGESEFRFGRAD